MTGGDRGRAGGRLCGIWSDLRALVRLCRGDLSALDRPKSDPDRALTVVLGAQVRPGGVPSRTLAARARHAGALYARGAAGRIAVSGGVGEHPPSEANVMAGILAGYGVPDRAILREAASHSTRQSAHHVATIARRLGVEEVVLVTDPLHCVRAASAFRAEGLRVWAEPVTESPAWRETGERRAQFVRELGAGLWYGLWSPSG